jgi:hypothetical protein
LPWLALTNQAKVVFDEILCHLIKILTFAKLAALQKKECSNQVLELQYTEIRNP